MDENMGDRELESISLLRDSGFPQPIGSWMSISSQEVKCYMTDIVIECVLNTTNHPNSTTVQMNVELLNNTTDESEILLFKKISSSEWKYDRIVELTHEVTFKATLDDMGRVAYVKLEEIEVEKFRSITGLTESAHNFLIEQEDHSMFRLKFQIVSIPLDGNYLKETFTDIMKKDSKRLFSMIQDLPDHMVNKPIFLNECGAHFLECFRKSRSMEDIDNSVLANRLALQLTVAETLPVVQFLNDSRLSLAVGSDHVRQHLDDVNQPVANLNTVETARSGIHLQLPLRLNSTGVSLRHHFEVIGDPTVIMEAISLQQKAVQLTPEGHGDMPNYLIELAHSLRHQFIYANKIADIDEAISFQQKAIRLTPESHANMASYLSELGESLRYRFLRKGELTDIYEAVSFQQKAVQHTPEGDQNMPIYLSRLADALQRRYLRTRELPDISAEISFRQKAVQLTSEGHENMPRYLSELGESLRYRFLRIGDLRDISEAVSFQHKAVQHTPEGDQNMPRYLYQLADALQQRYLRTGELADISAVISFRQKSIQLTSEGHEIMPRYLCELGESLRYRFSRTGELTDVSEAISVQRKAVQHTPEGDRYMPVYLSALVSSLQIRFRRTGELADISEAISWQQKAVQVPPEGIQDMPIMHVPLSLYALGDSLRQRFLHTGELTDISEAISFQQKFVQLIPEDDQNMPCYLSELGECLRYRFSRTGEFTDISESISLQRKAVQVTPEGHANMSTYLADLGASLQQRFICTGELADISEAISYQRKGIQLSRFMRETVPNHYLSDLGVSLRHRSISTRELSDISEAISLQQEAVQFTPDDHPNIARFLSSLACSLSSRFDYTGDITDINMAISKFSIAANSNYGSPSVRLNAAKDWIAFAQKYDPSQLLDAHRSAILLIPCVAGLEQTIEKRHNNLVDISALSSSAAAAAFASERTDLALEWLEQGRCLVWSQLNNLRTPLETLRSHDPKIADEVRSVSRALEIAGSRGASSISIAEANMLQKSSLQDEIAAHVKLAQQWDQLLAMVRNIPGLEDFLKPPSAANLLRNLPNSGVVILINVHQDRCDALALRSGIEPLHIALPEFSCKKADNLRTGLKIRLLAAGSRMRESKPDDPRGIRRLGPGHGTSLQQILATLWILVVKPILNGLGYSEPPRDLMRIWWCVSGPLAFLPIHAAGIYDGSAPGIGSALSDFAISSYTPTVRVLIDGLKSPQEYDKDKSGLFMISQPDTPHLPHIPWTTEEVRRVEQKLVPRDVRVLHLDSTAATVDRGIANMRAYSCIHFACHAQQHNEKPLKSGFSLYDGRLELLSIIQQRLVGADLAFLSACQTSAGDEKLSEEAVHLAAGMLAAGYRGAVATMWSIRDKYGPIIAEDFYLNLTKDSEHLSGEYAARALHHATQNLRKSLGDSESALLIWVPYVHFGL